MQVTITGATGLVGRRLVQRLRERGDELTVLSRDPGRASAALGVPAVAWNPEAEPAPSEALAGRDAVVHLAGSPIAQRWTPEVKRAIRESRERGTANLVAGIVASDPRPQTLVSASAVGYYGPHGSEPLDEGTGPGNDLLAQVCVAWEGAAQEAAEIGVRVVRIRTGIALAAQDGALAKMLPPFKLGVGGPVAGGRQMMPWIHLDDLVGMYVAALDDERWEGPVNATAPTPVSNAAFSRALGAALNRPAVLPVPAAALKLLYGEMATIVLTGQNAVPRRAQELGYVYAHPDLGEALRSALAAG